MPILAATAPALAQKLQSALQSQGLADASHPLATVYYTTLAQVILEHIDTTLQGTIRLDMATTTTTGTVGPGIATAGSPASQATISPGVTSGAGTLVSGIASIG
jgi:hypothetical protein